MVRAACSVEVKRSEGFLVPLGVRRTVAIYRWMVYRGRPGLGSGLCYPIGTSTSLGEKTLLGSTGIFPPSTWFRRSLKSCAHFSDGRTVHRNLVLTQTRLGLLRSLCFLSQTDHPLPMLLPCPLVVTVKSSDLRFFSGTFCGAYSSPV